MSETEQYVIVFCIMVAIAFWREIKEFVAFAMVVVFGCLVLCLTWLSFGVFASIGFAIRLQERFSKNDVDV